MQEETNSSLGKWEEGDSGTGDRNGGQGPGQRASINQPCRRACLKAATTLPCSETLWRSEFLKKGHAGARTVGQWSPNFLAPGTGSMEDKFSADWVRGGEDGLGMIQALYIQAHLLLSAPYLTGPDRYWSASGGWGPLL